MNALSEIIKAEIRKKGRLTFAEFMDLALYHPELGYYTSGAARIGKHGDYYTSPSVDPAFGEVLAGFISKSARLIGEERFRIIEFGGGEGALASDILASLERDHPEFYNKVEYLIIEKRETAQSRTDGPLVKHGHKIRFAARADDIDPGGEYGVVLSNELVDALPFHRIVFSGGSMKEIFVTLRNGEFAEIYDEPSTQELHEYFDGYGINFLEGQEAEVNLNAAGWIAEAGRMLKNGLILTIDYGFLAPALYSPERMKGTYKCMYMHNIHDGPYVNIGRQDITAHVDFSNLVRSGEALGLGTVKYTTQGQFLIDWGVLDIMEKESGNTDAPGQGRNKAIKNLFLPGSMGSSFKVLLQSKNINAEGFYPESPFKLSFGII